MQVRPPTMLGHSSKVGSSRGSTAEDTQGATAADKVQATVMEEEEEEGEIVTVEARVVVLLGMNCSRVHLLSSSSEVAGVSMVGAPPTALRAIRATDTVDSNRRS